MIADPADRLHPTAALVMLWSGDLYRTGRPARFRENLDLSAGLDLKQRCDRVCPWYHEVILNRKWLISRRAARFIRKAGTPCQVIIPAAGQSPLALELLDSCSGKITSVIETDVAGMEEKQ